MVKEIQNKEATKEIHAHIENMEYKSLAPLFCTIIHSNPSPNTLLLQSLIKIYTNKTIGKDSFYPITCTVSKEKRITFKVMRNDLVEYMDCAKISDIVLFVIDKNGITDKIKEFISLLKYSNDSS